MSVMRLGAFVLFSASLGIVAAAPAPAVAPTVTLGAATVKGTASGNVNEFLGIPFAQPPVGNLRFSLPVLVDSYNGTVDATAYGAACPQQINLLPLPPGLSPVVINIIEGLYNASMVNDEDCLSLNVVVPKTATPTSKLPVAVWIFGGGFEIGSTSGYDGATIVERSIALGEPIVYVSMNYRLSAFGFLASQEVKDAGVGNLGLQDQRVAFRWVQNNIAAFGGDPSKVTIWGESAGAISVALHMVTNGGDSEGLFRGAFMESGSPIPVGDITEGQPYYDALVSQTSCDGSADTLQCLRGVPYDKLLAAVNESPGIFSYQGVVNLAWRPRVDGVFLTDEAPNLVLSGSVAPVPFVTGDCDDEGTLFSFASLNITTENQLKTYLQDNDLPNVSANTIDDLLQAYPQDPSAGSPFDTGLLNEITPQYKRLSAIQGDMVFNGPRRAFLAQRSSLQKTWSFLSKRFKTLAILGSAHATDLIDVYGIGDLQDYLIHFVVNLDPNGSSGISFNWPQYNTDDKQLLTLLPDGISLAITKDDYREQGMSLIMGLLTEYPL